MKKIELKNTLETRAYLMEELDELYTMILILEKEKKNYKSFEYLEEMRNLKRKQREIKGKLREIANGEI